MTSPVTPPPADPPKDPPTTQPPAADPPKPDDQPLGAAGLKALQEERDARKALEKRLAALEPLAKFATALNGDGDKPPGKTDVELLNERLSGHEKTLTEERQARWRAEVANEKGLTAAQAARLRGASRDEMLADADDLLTVFATANQPRTPAPDPSQGSRGTANGLDLDAQIKDAQTKGDWRRVISLQNEKLANLKN
jgi:hypothetical protein